MRWVRNLALALFLTYLAVFPGATLTVGLDRVPAWGESLGGALLILQGAVVLCWLISTYGRRGAGAGLMVFLLAWGVEYIGVTSGFPFGRYSYTALLQPQLFGAVPLAIPCAWLMVGIGSWQIATVNVPTFQRSNVPTLFLAATLVLLLDLQIETVATEINAYWVWRDRGPYYGVPTANFIAWWLVGLAIALVVSKLLASWPRVWATQQIQLGFNRAMELTTKTPRRQASWFLVSWCLGGRDVSRAHTADRIIHFIPAALYLLSTLMFVAMNLLRGYGLAGLVGVVVLVAAASRLVPRLGVFTLIPPHDVREAE